MGSQTRCDDHRGICRDHERSTFLKPPCHSHCYVPSCAADLFDGFFDRPKALLSPHFPAGQWWNFDLSSCVKKTVPSCIRCWLGFVSCRHGRQTTDGHLHRRRLALLRSGPFTDLLDELGRRARKRGVGVTHHAPTADLMKNPVH